MRRIWVVPLLALMACAHVQMSQTCPQGSTGVGFALSGSTVGNTALSMLGGVATKAGFMAGASTPAPDTATMDYTYIPIFGADAGSLSCIIPPTQTVIVTSPPATVLRP